MEQQKHVLMISVDQLGRNHTELGGDLVSMMPTLRYLGQHGIEFDHCYSECPVCIPARRSLMTGLSPRTHGDRVYSDRMIMPQTKTLAQVFRENGYQAYAVGKLHVYPQRDRIGFDDVWLVEEGRYEFGTVDDYQIWLGEQGYAGAEFMHGMGNNIYYTRSWHLPEYTHPTNWITKKMCDMIKRRDPKRPGFFYASYQFPHPPLVPLQSYLDQYEHAELPEPLSGDWEQDSGILEEMMSASRLYSEREKNLARKAYYAQCTHIDHQIRILIGTLRECNMLDDTLIVFLSDHGDMLFDHQMVTKRTFYESSANVPMVLAGKPIEKSAGKTDHRLCCLQDVMPTILEICGLEIPETVEGISMVSNQKRACLYGEVGEGRKATRMIRTDKWKLIYYPSGNVVQLFDMENDREELHNLADEPQLKEIKEQLESLLIQNLYGKDQVWVEQGHLKGAELGRMQAVADYGLYNQRGYHWPPPQGYSNIGKNA